jgi:hypothetical protein
VNPGELYAKLYGKILANAFARARGWRLEHFRQELIGVAGLAFWLAWLDRERCRIKLEDWLMLSCINAMRNHIRSLRRRRRRETTHAGMDDLPGRPELCLDVSEDAEQVAWHLIHHGYENGRRAAYRDLGYEKTWDCIRELQEAFS